MHHVAASFRYPTPPASPALDKYMMPSQMPTPRAAPCPTHFMPVTAEARLGILISGSLRLTGVIGTGAYGIVYDAVDMHTNTQYAVKCLSKVNADGTPVDQRQVDFQTREIRLHYLASAHRNVVSMFKMIDNPDCTYVIMEYCAEGDLFQNITERGQYVGKDALAKDIFLQILDAVEFCHTRGIYHRDLKPENILVTDQGRTAKLADFGLATSSDRSEEYGCGSTFYMSPECLDHSARRPFYYCAPNDVWSLGVILVNLTCGRNPWKQASVEDPTYRHFVRNPNFLKKILPLTDELNTILGRIFTRDPEQRITLPELRDSIRACSRFTVQPGSAVATALLSTPPDSPVYHAEYEDESAVVDDELLSPAFSDNEALPSPCSSDDDFSDDDDDDGLIGDPRDPHEARTPPPIASCFENGPAIFDADDFLGNRMLAYSPEFAHQYTQPAPLQIQQHVHVVPSPGPLCLPKLQKLYSWDFLNLAATYPPPHSFNHPAAFPNQVFPSLAASQLQGCCY